MMAAKDYETFEAKGFRKIRRAERKVALPPEPIQLPYWDPNIYGKRDIDGTWYLDKPKPQSYWAVECLHCKQVIGRYGEFTERAKAVAALRAHVYYHHKAQHEYMMSGQKKRRGRG